MNLKTYIVYYTDEDDIACPVFKMKVRAYDREHAMDVFYDSPDSVGWQIVKVEIAFNKTIDIRKSAETTIKFRS